MNAGTTASVPRTAAPASPLAKPRRTNPKTFAIKAIEYLVQLAVPVSVAGYTMIDDSGRIPVAVVAIILALLVAVNIALSYLAWYRLTYTVGAEDIRVEAGILNRTARSVPFERIQDVSLEEKLLPRLFGLTEVKFETGAGGGDDLTLSYLGVEEGGRLRDLVRERRDGIAPAPDSADASPAPTDADTVFAMDTRRVQIGRAHV